METENNEQIARETFVKLSNNRWEDGELIILSAIEKAVRELREQVNHTQRLIVLTDLSRVANGRHE